MTKCLVRSAIDPIQLLIVLHLQTAYEVPKFEPVTFPSDSCVSLNKAPLSSVNVLLRSERLRNLLICQPIIAFSINSF